MVKKTIVITLLFSFLFLGACSNDLLGLFGSNDLGKRLREKDSFKFLTPADRTLSLAEPYSFIVLADTHIEDGDAFGLEQLQSAVTANSASFAVICGDITQNGKTADIQKFIDIANSLSVPCYPVIGNHDVFFGNFPNWKDLIGSTSYMIDGSNITLLMLDSANGYFGKGQLDWLEKEAKAASGGGKRVFVFTHSNLFVKNLMELQQFSDAREVARVCSILHGRCDAMFMGHTHNRLERQEGSVDYITVDGFKATKYYCLVTVNNSGVSWEYKKL